MASFYVNPLCTEHLLGLGQEETIEFRGNIFRFFNYVKSVLPNNDPNTNLAAAKTLGEIIEAGRPAFDETFMEYELPGAIELLQSDRQESRFSGVLILKEFALHNAAFFHPHIPLVFDKILIPLRDPRTHIREAAADLLAACLEIVTQRERQTNAPFLTKILQDAQAGIRMNSVDVMHGSLLTFRELLLHAGMVSFFVFGSRYRCWKLHSL